MLEGLREDKGYVLKLEVDDGMNRGKRIIYLELLLCAF